MFSFSFKNMIQLEQPTEPSTISILKPDNIGQIVSFSNIPDFLNLLFVDHYFRDVATEFPPWTKALQCLENANSWDICCDCYRRMSGPGKIICDCKYRDGAWSWLGDEKEAALDAAPLNNASFLRSDPRRRPSYWTESPLHRLKKMADFTRKASNRLSDELLHDLHDSLNCHGGCPYSGDMPYWVNADHCGDEYQKTCDFYSSMITLSKPALKSRVTDYRICRFIYNARRLPTADEMVSGSARANVMANLIDSSVAACELYNGQSSIYWYKDDVYDSFTERFRVRAAWGSSLRSAKEHYLEGLYGIDHWKSDTTLEGVPGTDEHLLYMVNLTKHGEHEENMINMFGMKIYESHFDVHGPVRKRWPQILALLQTESESEDAWILEHENDSTIASRTRNGPKTKWEERVNRAIDSEHFKFWDEPEEGSEEEEEDEEE